jgi:hypothetical protein
MYLQVHSLEDMSDHAETRYTVSHVVDQLATRFKQTKKLFSGILGRKDSMDEGLSSM